jgi:hypothetical protein
MERIFKIDEIQAFWEDANRVLPRHDNRIFTSADELGYVPTGEITVYLPDILNEVLAMYDNEPHTPSIAAPRATIIPADRAWNETLRLLSIPLWQHVICAGTVFLTYSSHQLEISKNWTVSGLWMTLIAVIGHDLGKLRILRPTFPDKYQSSLHPKYGADELSRIIGDRLPERIRQKILNAVLNHHCRYRECVDRREKFTIAVMLCDRLSRKKEVYGREEFHWPAFKDYFE